MHEHKLEVATLGGGCFWCLEAVYQELTGVSKVVSGYAGGTQPNPDYQTVCSGQSGHAEVVQVSFDPAQITYEQLLLVFFSIHDPTSLNRQGADVGTQYRSVIFTHSAAQQQQAQAMIAALEAERAYTRPIVTELAPLQAFYPAEAYHQNYFRRNPYQGYCQMVIAPKLAKFRKDFKQRQAPGK